MHTTPSLVLSVVQARRPAYGSGSRTLDTGPPDAGGDTGFRPHQQGLFNLLAVNAVVRTNGRLLLPSLRDFLG